MRNRPQFQRAARALRQGTDSLLLQARDRGDGSAQVNVGFTCSRKLGNAVARNRAKRRLRHLAAEILPEQARPGWDYVLIGRPDKTAMLPFEQLRRDLRFALGRVHGRT
ncbi:ribonuclease P protein component [Paracoccus sp. (in: a-proteobacteria)]|uniref:ribonuclease P protein component n=1 Tax=Paracoccus sp. TaxID=267 RepID=UPI003A8489A0